MGIFSIFQSQSSDTPPSPASARADSIRSGAAPPNRAERQRCWAARDVFFACLDNNSVVDATQPPGSDVAGRRCAAPLAAFERDCAAEWVKYFKQWRVADHKRRTVLESLRKQGAVEMQVTPQVGVGPPPQK